MKELKNVIIIISFFACVFATSYVVADEMIYVVTHQDLTRYELCIHAFKNLWWIVCWVIIENMCVIFGIKDNDDEQ